jgi:hypothetical protein
MSSLQRLGEQLRDRELGEVAAREHRSGHARHVKRRVAGLAVALALIAAIVVSVTPAGASNPINRAPAAAESAKTVRFSSTLAVWLNGRRLTSFEEHGALDFVHDEFDTSLSTGEQRVSIERRKIGDALYLAMRRGPRAPRWRRFRVASSPGPVPLFGTSLVDPEVALQVMRKSRSRPSRLGTELIDGTRSEHYRIATTLGTFLSAQDANPVQATAVNSAGGTLDVWVDPNGRPTRVDVRFSGPSNLGAATIVLTLNFASYGAPASLLAPPSDLVTDEPTRLMSAFNPLHAIERILFGVR